MFVGFEQVIVIKQFKNQNLAYVFAFYLLNKYSRCSFLQDDFYFWWICSLVKRPLLNQCVILEKKIWAVSIQRDNAISCVLFVAEESS